MAKSSPTSLSKKKAARKALSELLSEDRKLFRAVVLEAIEDYVLGELVLEGRKTKFVPREDIFRILEGKE